MKKINENETFVEEDIEESLIEKVLLIAEKEYETSEIFDVLAHGDEVEKPIAILNLNKINSSKEADLLINHLTGCDGRIREIVAFKILELAQGDAGEFFLSEFAIEKLFMATQDINPNVCRHVVDFFEICPSASSLVYEKLIHRANEILKELEPCIDSKFSDNKQKNGKNREKNRVVFNLYWALEAVSACKINDDVLEILEKCSDFLDYTIREKTAKILSKMANPPEKLLQKLKADVNFYVKKQLCDKI